MRKTFNLLFICLIALYGWIGYQVIHTTDLPQCQPEGRKSVRCRRGGDRHPFENKRTLFFEQD